MTAFHRAVFRLVGQIPRGRVATYGQIAAMLGWPRAARAVGYAMRHCPAGVPWHRVVNASGGISLRANVSGMLTQRLLLEQEGVAVKRGTGQAGAPPVAEPAPAAAARSHGAGQAVTGAGDVNTGSEAT